VQKGIEQDLNFNILENIISDRPSKANLFSKEDILSDILLYGLYPERMRFKNPRNYLLELADSAIFKDIVELNLIENRSKAKELLKLLSYQIGNLISYSEIASKLSLDRRTVERYIDIFEQSYVVFRVYPYSKNKRDELGKMPKIYFHDLGLRNALIDDFNFSNLRLDFGAIFENFIMSELRKSISYQQSDFKINFWRSRSGAEMDIILSNSVELYGVEVKWQERRISAVFLDRYPHAQVKVISKKNFY
jgi:hypothetical protein